MRYIDVKNPSGQKDWIGHTMSDVRSVIEWIN